MKATKCIRWTLIVGVIFFAGFLLGAKQPEPKWVGYLVSGKAASKSNDPGILIPPPDPFISSVDSSIVIGLREDGVVVWKKRETTKNENGN